MAERNVETMCRIETMFQKPVRAGGMTVTRSFLSAGHVLILGGTPYIIENMEGCGNNSILYRAAYEDGLNGGSFHKVLIKELFPYDPKGGIYRTSEGEVCHTAQAGPLWEYHRLSFYRGNQVNLALCGIAPDRTMGNINSYEAFGTYYSILELDGGQTLADILAERTLTLGDAVGYMTELLNALACFHDNGYLHLDISPENILVTGGRVILIDYNSVWPICRENTDGLFYSFKEGYTAPEVRLRTEPEIGTAADIYSVCAVFFQMLTGRRPDVGDTMGRGLRAAFPKDLPVFEGVPASAAYAAVKIIARGLYSLPDRRYTTVEELLAGLAELDARLKGRGLTRSALWENSRRACPGISGLRGALGGEATIISGTASRPKGAFASLSYIERIFEDASGEVLNEGNVDAMLYQGRHVLLCGSGGMGKTSYLRRVWAENVQFWRPANPVVLYIALDDYQDSVDENHFIQKRILSSIDHGLMDDSQAMARLDRMMADGEAGVWMILLLDGADEAGRRCGGLFREIESLSKKSGVALMIAGRSGGRFVSRLSGQAQQGGQTGHRQRPGAPCGSVAYMAGLEMIRLLPLPPSTVRQALDRQEISCPADASLAALLSNPMMLSLYIQVSLSKDAQSSETGGVSHRNWSEAALIGVYFEEIRDRQLRLHMGEEGELLRMTYLFDHLLPGIAGELLRRKKTLLTVDAMTGLLAQDYRRLRSKEFGRAFGEYLGKSRLLLEGLANASEWYDYAVCEQLTGRLGLLKRTENGSFSLVHDNFSGYLTDLDAKNQAVSRKAALWGRLRNGLMVGAALLVIGGGIGTALWRRPFPSTRAEISSVENAMNCLAWNMQLLDNQLATQLEFADSAMDPEVLGGDASACRALAGQAERKLEAASLEVKNAGKGQAWIEALSTPRNTIPLDTLQSLYLKSEQLQPLISDACSFLITAVCEEPDSYTQSHKVALISAYAAYLQAYGDVAYLEFMEVALAVGPQERSEIFDFMAKTRFFSRRMVAEDFKNMTPEEEGKRLEAAKTLLLDAQNEMLMLGFPVNIWP